ANRLRGRLAATTLYTGIPADALADLAIVATNKVKNGAVKFSDFSKQMVNEFGKQIEPCVEKLYRESLVSLDLSKGRQILNSSGKVIDEAVVREAKEKVFDFMKNNKPVELQEFIEGKNGVRNRYGNELADELNKPEMASEDFALSFYNEETANRALGKFVNENKGEIKTFLNDPRRLETTATFDFGESAGIVVERGKSGSKVTNKVLVVLVKDNSEKGWRFLTAFPK
ncbi:MAG: RNase A-like domain-containing protein, partial [Pyrinomonadaceae bacterium]